MAQSTTNLGKIHVFPSETLYNQFKDIIADNDLALLKDDGAYIIAANLAQNGYVKFSNGLILQWGLAKIQPPGSIVNLNISCDIYCISATSIDGDWPYIKLIDNTKFKLVVNAQKAFWICLGIADK